MFVEKKFKLENVSNQLELCKVTQALQIYKNRNNRTEKYTIELNITNPKHRFNRRLDTAKKNI